MLIQYSRKSTNPPGAFPEKTVTMWNPLTDPMPQNVCAEHPDGEEHDLYDDNAFAFDPDSREMLQRVLANRRNKGAYLRAIRCRLLQSKYTWGEAHARCSEIHGTSFDGCFRSGRFFVFWENIV